MTSKTLRPGDEVWTLNEYYNTVSKQKVVSVANVGPLLKGDSFPTSFASVFDTESDAAAGLIARAEKAVTEAEKKVTLAKIRLGKMQKKWAKVLSEASA